MFIFGIDIKAFFAAIASIIVISAYIPYLTSMLSGRTQPHVYTWLIWTLTTGTASAGLWYGNGGYGVVSQTIGAVLTFLFFLLSFRYGTKNITRSDTIVLILAFLAIGVWWQLHQPLLAIVMVSLIDMLGYIPTYRKSWQEPWSESMSSWLLWLFYGFFVVLSLENYNSLTLTFLLAALAANCILITLLLVRRRTVPKPVS